MESRTPRIAAGLLAAALAAVGCAPRVEVQAREEGRFGTVRIFASAAPQAGLVFFFSDAAGWSGKLTTAARRIAGEGALVAGVDLPGYLRGLRASDDGCHYVVAEIEDLSQRLQREYDFPSYRSPILAGLGEGGTLAYAALAQAPAATLAGAIGVDPAPTLETRVPLCEGAPTRPAPGGGHRYAEIAELPGFWRVSTPAAGDSGDPVTRLALLVQEALSVQAAAAVALADLPLIELPVAGAATQLAVIYSGDGGWRDLDRQIAGVLAREGTPVVGVDSLRYFWTEKTPERVASDLARILRHYQAAWRVQRALLIGYSFGAGILPFAANRLPPDLRDTVVQISLLGLESRAPFQISVTGWLGAHDRGLPVRPELARLDPARVQCFYGQEEDDTACTAAELAGAERIRTPGGHHFDGDYQRLAGLILSGAARRASPPPQGGSG